jgi:molybdopterin-guanine dinucleotide biosynthesis protein A
MGEPDDDRALPPALVAVLAGGAARRMGAPKALALLGGRPLVSYPLAAAAAAGLEAVVIAKPDTPLPDLPVPVWREPPTPRHPLLGLVTALERAGRPVVAVACDQPWIPAELLSRLAAGDPAARATALRVAGRLEPLPARYAPEALPVLRAALAAEGPLRRTLETLDPAVLEADELRALGDPAALVAGVNTPEALADAERQLASRLS